MKKDRKRKKAKTASAVSVPVEATVSVSPSLQEGMQALQLLVDDLGENGAFVYCGRCSTVFPPGIVSLNPGFPALLI